MINRLPIALAERDHLGVLGDELKLVTKYPHPRTPLNPFQNQFLPPGSAVTEARLSETNLQDLGK